MAMFLLFCSPVPGAQRQVLQGHLPPGLQRLQALGELPANNRLDLAIGLRLRNGEALTNLLEQLYDPTSTNYHHFLTAKEFAERFGPTEKDYQAVIAFAKSNGLTLAGTHPNRAILDVSGSAANIEKAFQLKLRVFQHPSEARTFFGPDAEPSLELAVPISSISGLDNFVVPRPLIKSFHKGFKPSAYSTGSGPRGNFMGKDFRAAYAPGVSLDGAGQSVGLFQLDGYYNSDILAYERLAGLPNVSLTNVLLNGVSGVPGRNNIEVALDIEMAISMAPGVSKVIVYEGRTPNDILNRMATDNEARQLSSSWGFGAQVDATRAQIFMQFAAQGQSMFQASGDLGAWVGAIAPPSDDPFLTVVGGTLLTTGAAGDWESETTWPESGGGISKTNPLPIWQQGIDMSLNQGSTSKRNIPDVAAVADEIWVVVNNGEQGIIGGTSVSAPLWAGFAALANEQAAAAGRPRIGFLNPALYLIGKGLSYQTNFHDITTGNNTNTSSANNFFAVRGYDLCTGWGTPRGSNLIAALVTPPDTLRITPTANVTATGPVGGPFLPNAQSYSLTNFGTTPLSWTLANTSVWLSASPTGGTLSPGGPATTVTLSLNAAASNLAAGSYTATVWFTNVNEQTVQNRQFTLAVVAPPLITSHPANRALFEGMNGTFSVGTASNAFLLYQWRYDNGSYLTNLTDGGNIRGSGTSTLTVSNVSSGHVGAYSVIVSNAAGTAVSSNAFLSIVPWRPVITAQPTNQIVLPGQAVSLNVTAVGSHPISYRWAKNRTNLTDGGNISGAGSSTLTLSSVAPTNDGIYSVLVSNAFGFVTSSDAVVTLVPLIAPEITMTTLHSFTGDNGAGPNGLLQAADGYFYGTTQNGGTNFSGTIFRLAPSGSFTTLHSLDPGTEGANPFAALAQGSDANFYGTAFQGGAYDNGTIFRVSSNGILTPLISFNITNGDLPYAGLTLGLDGKFYGTTYQGGASGLGTVFKVSTNGQLTTLFSFNGGNDGGFPYATLTRSTEGDFYGTTFKGGAFNYGTVFRISSNGVLNTLFAFDYAEGALPYGGLVQGTDGNLYGTTSSGGAYGAGTLFRISSGLLTNLHSFNAESDGAGPAATLLEGSDGNFYGTTAYGGSYGLGTVFRMARDGALVTLIEFDGFNGANPKAAIVEGTDHNLHGTTERGGAGSQGTIFRLGVTSPPQITSQPANQAVFAGSNVTFSVAVFGSSPLFYQWRENDVNLSDGGNISGSSTRILTLSNVTIANAGSYSVMVSNAFGKTNSIGATLSVTSSAPIIVLQPTNQTLSPGATATFAVRTEGNLPISYQWQKGGTNLNDGGNLSGSVSSTLIASTVTEANNGSYAVIVSNSLGSVTSSPAILTVIPVSAPGTRLATLYSFAGGADGRIPNGVIQASDGDLYGTTQWGGAHLVGTAFRITTNGARTMLFSFSNTNGSQPRAALVQGADGNFYGTTQFGGSVGYGTIFKINSNGTLEIIYSFRGEADGGNPYAALIRGTDGNFYGTAQQGASYYGSVFKVTPQGALTTLYAFTNGIDGAFPEAALVQATDGNFYGTTPGGGSYGNGNAFRMTPAGNLATIYSFTHGTDGSIPTGALVQGTDGNLYGTTKFNTIAGFQFYGTIFRITTNGLLSTLYALNYGEGAHPSAGVIQASDGNFYGTTYDGAANGNGTLFRIAPNGSLTTMVPFDGFNDGAHPSSALIEGTDGSLYGTTTTGGPAGQGTVFRFSMTGAPEITTQPASQAVWPGANAGFSVAVFGAPPFFYHWQKNGSNLTDSANISGSSTRILNVANVTFADAGTYSVIVSNALNSVTSVGALLTVISPPVFQKIQKTNSTLRLTWSAIAGQRYQLQYKGGLTVNNWSNLGNSVVSSGSTVTASDPVGSNAQRFYRVVLVP